MATKARRPYKIPRPLLCSSDKTVDMALVDEYIAKHEGRMPRYKYLENLYAGFHDIFNQPEKEDWKPDNRLAVNFPRYITDTFLGYARGIPIKVTHDDKAVNDAITDFNRLNNTADLDYNLDKLSAIYGHGWEYFYQDEESHTRIIAVKPKRCFVVYDDTVRGKGLFGCRYEYRENGKRVGEYMTPHEIVRFEDDKATERKDNPYGMIPLVEHVMNDERIGLFEHVAGMVEVYNKAIAEKANDVDAFAEAYLSIIGAEVDEEGVKRIRDDRVINFYGTDNARDVLVQFLTKPTADGTQENLLERLETLIYQTAMVANISDESFGNVSGVALAYKLQAMDNLASTLDRKDIKSLSKRYKIFCSLSTNVKSKDAYIDIDYQPMRNVPKNQSEEAQTAKVLEGVVSKETQLKVLSIVDDPAEEIKAMEKEAQKAQEQMLENMQRQQEMFGRTEEEPEEEEAEMNGQ